MDVERGQRQLEALFARLDRERRTLKHHPTIDKIERGELSPAQLRHWATQLYIGNKGHNANILGLIYAKCDDFAARRAIVENLNEEELGRQSGTGRSHMELYLEFGEALGIPRAQMLRARMSPDATAMVHWMYWLADSRPWYTTLAGISLGSELHNPEAYPRVIAGLRRHYGLGEDAVRFFSVHVDVDREHGDSTAHSVFRVIPEDEAADALWAVETHIEFMRRLWADINPPSVE
ncbi:MAG TPA: iron-containing redox enzyme family protein [Candidatus Binataceae bacterium]|jgi:pyrroloquinoline quinone (PQQ) biosynthesis protein C|nr:iron-containing redox enzyme family protein [Candidatus Binataceae bacterium]